MSTTPITSSLCAETDSQYPAQVNNNSFDVGAFSTKVNEAFAYFDMSSIPAYAIVSSAVLTLRQYEGGYYNATVTMRAAPCTNYIANTLVSWNNKPTPSASIYADLVVSGNVDADRSWTLTGNLNTLRQDNILIVKVYALDTSAGDNNAKGFRPSTYATSAYRPQLTVTYTAIPMKIANDAGAIDKQVTAVKIAPTQGSTFKTVTGIKIAPSQGTTFKTVF